MMSSACPTITNYQHVLSLTITQLINQLTPSYCSVVIWPRIDQGTCVKTPQTAGCQLEVVEPLLEGESLVTDVGRIEELLRHHGDKVLCVMSTTSCFAPRTPDKLVCSNSCICSE